MSRFEFSVQSDGEDNTGGGDRFPSRLKEHDQWLVTQDKKPVIPSKGWQESENLLTFTEARETSHRIGGDVAFCFTESGPFVGFDLDDVKINNEFTDEARTIVQRLDSYTEVSSSGTGLHVIAEGDHLDDWKHRGDLSEDGHLEVYDQGRYFVLTGHVYDGFTSVESMPAVAREVQEDHLPKEQTSSYTGQQKPVSKQQFDGGQADVTPEKVRRTIKVYGRSSKTSVDEDTILRLWRGSDVSYQSTSEADMAFVAQLYFWCKGDEQLIDECFRASGRMRRKWDKVATSDRATYGEMTIRKVCRSNRKTFGGRYVERG